MDALPYFAFFTGLLGGFGHCIGMCGPVTASYTLSLKPHFLFNAGRITTYTFIGSLMGLAGSFVDTAGRLAGVQNLALLFVGILMIGIGLRMTGLLNFSLSTKPADRLIFAIARHINEERSIWKYYLLGMLLGLMPCGLSSTVFIGAAGAGGLLQGMATTLLFGIGTLPAMLLVGSAIAFARRQTGHFFRLVGGALVVVTGLVFLAKGIRLYVDL